MSSLKNLIETELKNRNVSFFRIGVKSLYVVAKENLGYTNLGRGMFFPDVGVIGDWEGDEKQVVKNILLAGEQESSVAHDFAKMAAKYDNPFVATHKDAYTIVKMMRPGYIAKIRVEKSDYLLAAFPAQMPATALVLFVK